METDRKVVGIWLGVIGLLALVAMAVAGAVWFRMPKVAYVNSSELMVAFSEANQANKAVAAEQEKYEVDLKAIDDSVKALMDVMSKEYDSAPEKRKREFEEKLAARNLQRRNFEDAGMKKLRKMHVDKMQSVVDKVNVFLKEYGKKHGYSIIYATTQEGNIAYGDPKYDITREVANALNERYK